MKSVVPFPESWRQRAGKPGRSWFLFGVFCVVLAVCSGVASDADEPCYRRWAIVATKPLEQTGLPDLLAAEITARKGLELVERQELDAITTELELAACFGAKATGNRLKLGRMLGADALLLLSLEEREAESLKNGPLKNGQTKLQDQQEQGTFVKVVISDCRYGARLWMEYLPYEPEQLAVACGTCTRLVEQTHRRFAGDIRQLIAVPHFLSKNLVRDHDHLQAGYAYLMEAALMSYPGVAVVETEEARAICHELELTGTELKDRALPVFVEGEYEMSAEKPDAEPTVRLYVRVSDGKKLRLEVRHDGLSLSAAIEQLTEVIPEQTVRLAQDVATEGFSRSEQVTMLTNRANAFSKFGGFEHSTGLREAALLLAPDDVQQGMKLVSEYLQMHQTRYRVQQREQQRAAYERYSESRRTGVVPIGTRDFKSEREKQEQGRAEVRARFRIIARHVEELVRSRMLNPNEANLLVKTVHHAMQADGLRPESPGTPTIADELFWRVYPLFPMLDYGLRDGKNKLTLKGHDIHEDTPAPPLRQYNCWANAACAFVAFGSARIAGSSGHPDHSRTLDDLFRFLTEVALPTVPLTRMATLTMTGTHGDLNGMITASNLKVGDVHRFYERLRGTGEPLHDFYGRLGLLSLKVNVLPGEKLGADAIKEVDALSKYVHDQDTGERDYRLNASYYDRFLDLMRTDIETKMKIGSREKRHQLPENPIPPIDPDPRVVFEPVEGVQVDWVGLLKCTDQFDVAWSCDTVYAISAPGVALQIFHVEWGANRYQAADGIYSVQWDGENLWIACVTSGVRIVSPSGKILGHLATKEGLPPYTASSRCAYQMNAPSSRRGIERTLQPLELHPIQPGKCIAIGSFGNGRLGSGGTDKRMWFAAISARVDTQNEVSFDLNVFHTAVELPKPGTYPADDNPREVFDLAWLTEYGASNGRDRRLLLLGRDPFRHSLRMADRAPLAIDLESLAVSIFPARIPSSGFRDELRYVVDGQIMAPTDHSIDLLSPPGGPSGEWTQRALVEIKQDLYRQLRVGLLRYDDALFNPGAAWRRIDPKTWQVQLLTDVPLPLRHRFQHYGVSTHWGLVAWNTGDRLFRISIDCQQRLREDAAFFYPEVPAPRRARHQQAVEAIRKLGGSVDARWGRLLFRESGPASPCQWRTIVYLGERWRGGDTGMAYLADLHNLSNLYLVRADVTDEGMWSVGQIQGLNSLCLVETNVTDVGLIHLQGLEELLSLQLEGPVDGRQFTDAGLKHIGGLTKLQNLTLYGDRFTDEGLPALQLLPRLQNFTLWDTMITKHGLSKLMKSRRGSLNIRQNGFR